MGRQVLGVNDVTMQFGGAGAGDQLTGYMKVFPVVCMHGCKGDIHWCLPGRDLHGHTFFPENMKAVCS